MPCLKWVENIEGICSRSSPSIFIKLAKQWEFLSLDKFTMMKFRIKKPCHKTWQEMSEMSGGRLCDLCEKKVWDLDLVPNSEIQNLISKNSICGKISTSKIIAKGGLLLAITFSTASCTTQKKSNNNLTELSADKLIKITGTISAARNVKIEPKEIMLVTKQKLFKGQLDYNQNFTLEIPESEIKNHNIIKVDFLNSKFDNEYMDSSLHFISRNELLNGKNIIADDGAYEIGAVVIITPVPPDFYYFDGKIISESKYEKIKKENPDFEEILLSDTPFKNVITKQYSGNIFLLYSN